jgi:hypothetical protein
MQIEDLSRDEMIRVLVSNRRGLAEQGVELPSESDHTLSWPPTADHVNSSQQA